MIRDVWLSVVIRWYRWRTRRLTAKLEPVMAQVLHAFQESDEEQQKQHLFLWFGYPSGEGIPEGPEPVCRCGASLTALKKDRSVLAVYHLRRYQGAA